MTREELLKKARDDYPEGTVYRGYNGFVDYVVKGELFYIHNNIYCRDLGGCIYNGSTKTWAKIVSKPIQKNVFKTFI